MEIDNKKLLITIGILLIIIVILGAYIKIGMKGKEVKAEKTVISNVSIDLNTMFQIGDSLNKLDNAFNDSRSKYFGYVYNSKKIKVRNSTKDKDSDNTFDKGAALFAALYNNLEFTQDAGKTIIGSKVKSDFNSIFGRNLNYVPKVEVKSGNYYKIKYDSSSDSFNYVLVDLNEDYHSEYITINVKTVLGDDKVIVTRKIAYVEYFTDKNGSVNAGIYTNKNKSKNLQNVVLKKGTINKDEIIGKYGTKLDTYEYTFMKENSKKYSLYSIEKIK